MGIADNVGRRFQNIRELTKSIRRQELEGKTQEELIDMVEALGRELIAYRDVTCGPESAARFFNRKRSWIYEAMSRPGTELQRSLSRIVAREPGGLLFRLSDLVRLRRRLFRKERRD